MSIDATTASAARGWTADDSTFGARLALVRQRMAWGSVAEAAKACGLPTESWRTWERDGVEPRRIVTIALAIAGQTGCDVNWLLGTDRVRSCAYVQPRVLTPARATSDGPPATTRPVRQTRPIIAAGQRPHSRIST